MYKTLTLTLICYTSIYLHLNSKLLTSHTILISIRKINYLYDILYITNQCLCLCG
jgi:hypothetical protein